MTAAKWLLLIFIVNPSIAFPCSMIFLSSLTQSSPPIRMGFYYVGSDFSRTDAFTGERIPLLTPQFVYYFTGSRAQKEAITVARHFSPGSTKIQKRGGSLNGWALYVTVSASNKDRMYLFTFLLKNAGWVFEPEFVRQAASAKKISAEIIAEFEET